MVTLVLSLVVVGGAMAAIVAMTLEGSGQPATTADRSTRDIRRRLSRVDLRRLAAALAAAPRPGGPGRPGRPGRPGGSDLVGARARTAASPVPTAPEATTPDTNLLVAAPLLAPAAPGDRPAGTDDAAGAGAVGIATARHDRPSGWGDEDPSPEAATEPWAGQDEGPARDDRQPSWSRPPEPRAAGAPTDPSPLRRSARQLRGALGLVLLLAVLGVLLAAVLAGIAVAVAVGVRAAIG